MAPKHEDCPVCKRKAAGLFAEKNGYELYKCGECGFIFVFPVPSFPGEVESEKDLKAGKERSATGENGALWEAPEATFARYLDILERHINKKGALFDVGAATGVFIACAEKRGWKASGIEISSHYASVGKNERNADIIAGNFEEYGEREGSFDLITFWDVLEHFTDPGKAMQNASRLLKSRGYLAVNTPDATSFPAKVMGRRWHLLLPPSHLHIFNEMNVKKFLEQHGFEVVYFGRVGKKFSLRNIFRILAIWQKRKILEKIHNWLSESRVGDLKISINTRDNQFLIARKKL